MVKKKIGKKLDTDTRSKKDTQNKKEETTNHVFLYPFRSGPK